MMQAFSVDRYLTIRTLPLKIAHSIELFMNCFSWTHITGGEDVGKKRRNYWNGNAFCDKTLNGLL